MQMRTDFRSAALYHGTTELLEYRLTGHFIIGQIGRLETTLAQHETFQIGSILCRDFTISPQVIALGIDRDRKNGLDIPASIQAVQAVNVP